MKHENGVKVQKKTDDTLLHKITAKVATEAIEYFCNKGLDGEIIATSVEDEARKMRMQRLTEEDFKENVAGMMRQLQRTIKIKERDNGEYVDELFGLSVVASAFARSHYNDFFRYLASLQK